AHDQRGLLVVVGDGADLGLAQGHGDVAGRVAVAAPGGGVVARDGRLDQGRSGERRGGKGGLAGGRVVVGVGGLVEGDVGAAVEREGGVAGVLGAAVVVDQQLAHDQRGLLVVVGDGADLGLAQGHGDVAGRVAVAAPGGGVVARDGRLDQG